MWQTNILSIASILHLPPIVAFGSTGWPILAILKCSFPRRQDCTLAGRIPPACPASPWARLGSSGYSVEMTSSSKVVWTASIPALHKYWKINVNDTTTFNLITAHTPISTQANNSLVFKLQLVYFLSTSLYRKSEKKLHKYHQVSLFADFF